jgi:hypothetical protein
MTDWRDTVSSIRAVAVYDGEQWSAQCLDYDLAAQARTPEGLCDEIVRAIAVHVAASSQLGCVPFEGFKPAPRRFWELYENGERWECKPTGAYTLQGSFQLPFIIPEIRKARL